MSAFYPGMGGEVTHSSRPRDWETGLHTDLVGDHTLVFSSILTPDRIYFESTLCRRQSHPLCELKILLIEDPMDGDISVR